MTNKLFLSTLLFIAISCNENSDTDAISVDAEKVKKETIIYEPVATPHDLELNNGERWKVSRGMKKPIGEIIELASSYSGSSLVDLQLLGDRIGKQTSKVIRKCDMTGRAHNELHKWLLPFLDLKEALVMAASADEGAAILQHINNELEVYKTYFE